MRIEEEVGPTVGLPCNIQFVGFITVPVQTLAQTNLFTVIPKKKQNLRPDVRRKSDLPLHIGQIHAFYFDTTPYTLNDDVNAKSV